MEFLSFHALSCEFHSLVESVFTSVRSVNHFHHFGVKSEIESLILVHAGLEISTTGQNQSAHIGLVISDKTLSSQFANLSGENLSSLHSDSSKSDTGLPSLIMFLGEIDMELMYDFFGTALNLCEKGAITIDDNEPERGLALQNGPQLVGLEARLAGVDTDVDGFERLEVDHELLVCFAVLVNEVVPAEEHKPLGRTSTV